jgi:hypothetical protein
VVINGGKFVDMAVQGNYNSTHDEPTQSTRQRVEKDRLVVCVLSDQFGADRGHAFGRCSGDLVNGALKHAVRRILAKTDVDATCIERPDQRDVGQEQDMKALRAQLLQRAFRKFAGQHCTQKRVIPAEFVRQGQDRPLYFLGFVARVLGVAAPGNFDERNRLAIDSVAATPFDNKVEIVHIAVTIGQRHFLTASNRPASLLVVEIKSLLAAKLFEIRKND